jgi:hypothetical protein
LICTNFTRRNFALSKTIISGIPDPRWKDLYRIGGIASILIAVSLVFAIVAYFIWPFKPGLTSTENIFVTLHANRLGGLMSLDLPFPIIVLLNILPLLALYVALKQTNESYALIAVVLGLVAAILLLPSRPLAELVYFSDKYAAATTEAEKLRYLSAGESFHALFNGTTWMMYTVLGSISTLIFTSLMLQSGLFGKVTAYMGIVSAIGAQGVFIPVIGPLLSLLATFGAVLWSMLIARDLFGLGRQIQTQSNKE